MGKIDSKRPLIGVYEHPSLSDRMDQTKLSGGVFIG